jgi:hypothetical protein
MPACNNLKTNALQWSVRYIVQCVGLSPRDSNVPQRPALTPFRSQFDSAGERLQFERLVGFGRQMDAGLIQLDAASSFDAKPDWAFVQFRELIGGWPTADSLKAPVDAVVHSSRRIFQ